ncbi:alpha/beta hydrolase [Brevundimonas variabilis]|uniref:Pimeloyl-ACP methyl ester carboxylesterase n=1 Tax=Brevundimonas variabilis TaxID=74312 RepID=A0A7W9FEZ5_9CAUL|nr:alpha/beta hydrolase [Brevundimonas variabilis]MBB5746877.1 pimeloyl-ACP methyl ester carboxylesterase [Brevundimonas variabilis]
MTKTTYRASARLALGALIVAISCGTALAEDVFTPCGDSALAGLAGSLCAVSHMPLRPNDPEAGAVNLFIRKFPSASGTTTGEIWLIAGGPGESGASFYPFLDTFRRAFPDRDLIVPDHRGTGYSTRLCPAEEAADSPAGPSLTDDEWGSCIGSMYRDVERTHAFTITNASHDLSQIITRYRGDGSVQVYAVSYGTQLVLRMLQAAPVPLDGIVLDGLVPLESSPEWDLSHRTKVVDKVGRNLLSPAQAHAYAALLKTPDLDALVAPSAPGGNLRQFLGTLLNFPDLRDQIPAVLSGLGEGDASRLVQVRAELNAAFEPFGRYPQSSPALPLVFLMNASENNGRRDLTANVVEAEARDALFTSPLPGLLVSPSAPLYDRDAYFGRPAVALPRTLVVHGTLDPNTPYEGAVDHASELAKAGDVTFATVVDGAHMLPFVAPECFVRIVSAFDARTEVPSSCASRPQRNH